MDDIEYTGLEYDEKKVKMHFRMKNDLIESGIYKVTVNRPDLLSMAEQSVTPTTLINVDSTYIWKITFIVGSTTQQGQPDVEKLYWSREDGTPLVLPNAGTRFEYEHAGTLLIKIYVKCKQILQPIWFETSHFKTNDSATSPMWADDKIAGDWKLYPVFNDSVYSHHENVFKYRIKYGAKDNNGRFITSHTTTAGINDYKFIVKDQNNVNIIF